MSKLTIYRGMDKAGIVVSSACAIHCALMPFILVALPFVSLGILVEETFEWVMFGIAAGIGLLSVGWGYWKHKAIHPLLIALFGVLSLLIGNLMHHAIDHAHHSHSHAHEHLHTNATPYATSLLVIGGITMVIAHWYNMKVYKSCECHCTTHKNRV